ncbi:hypothetical protein CISIN_1g044058mg, partial [Citrus sinensis]
HLLMASDNFVQPVIPCFDGHYDHWSMLMENFLRSKEYWQVVEYGVAEPAERVELDVARTKNLKGSQLKDLKAIDRSILKTILRKRTSKDKWDSMKKKFEGSARAQKTQL